MAEQDETAAPRRKPHPAALAVAALAALGALGVLAWQYSRLFPSAHRGGAVAAGHGGPKYVETEDGRKLLWAGGPRDPEAGEWFDVTGSPLDPGGYQFGIGKDRIPSIDRPQFARAEEADVLAARGITGETIVIGYAHGGTARAYPVHILNHHELVNDTVGGKPVTVGW